MTGKLSKNFHGVGIGPLSSILAVNGSLLAKQFNLAGKVTNLLRYNSCKYLGLSLGIDKLRKYNSLLTYLHLHSLKQKR